MLKYAKGDVHDVPESIIRVLACMVAKSTDKVPLLISVNCNLDPDKLLKLKDIVGNNTDIVNVETDGTVDIAGSIVLSRNTPSGFPLEYLVEQITKDLDEKSNMVSDDHSLMAEVVKSNNSEILKHLETIRLLHEETRATLEYLAKDSGVKGKPRIGGG